jgi:hypothetical protein
MASVIIPVIWLASFYSLILLIYLISFFTFLPDWPKVFNGNAFDHNAARGEEETASDRIISAPRARF